MVAEKQHLAGINNMKIERYVSKSFGRDGTVIWMFSQTGSNSLASGIPGYTVIKKPTPEEDIPIYDILLPFESDAQEVIRVSCVPPDHSTKNKIERKMDEGYFPFLIARDGSHLVACRIVV